MLNLLLIAIAISSPDATLNIEHGGQSMGALFKEVSKQTQSTWRVAAEFEPIIVTVRLDDVPEAEFRDKLASQMDGRWKRLDHGWRLEPDPKKVAETRKKNFDRRVAAIKDLQKTAREQVKRFETWNEEREDSLIDAIRVHASNIAENRSVGPSVRALTGMLGQIPTGEVVLRMFSETSTEELANSGEIHRFVYSSNPSGRQRRLPASVANRLERALTRQARFVEKARASIIPKGSASGYVHSLLRSGQMSETVSVRAVVDAPQWSRDYVAINVIGLDRDGKSTWDLYDGFRLSMPSSPIPEPYASAVEIVPLEPFTSQFQKHARPDNIEPLPIELLEKFESPEVHDPIRLSIGDWLVRFAANRKKNLIATIPDGALSAALQGFTNNMTANSRFAPIAKTGHVAWSADGEWLLAKTSDPDSAIGSFTPRKAMGRFMKAIREGIKLDNWIEFVGSLEPASLEKVLLKEMMRLYPETEGLLYNENWEALKLVYLLGPAKRNELFTAHTIPISSFPTEAKKWLDLALANNELSLAPTTNLLAGPNGFGLIGENGFNIIEPTSWPDLESKSGVLYFALQGFSGAFVGMNGNRGSIFHPADSIGRGLAESEKNGTDWYRDATSFRAALRENCNFEIRFSNGVSAYWTKRIDIVSSKAVPSMDLLPEDLREVIERARQKHLKPPPGR